MGCKIALPVRSMLNTHFALPDDGLVSYMATQFTYSRSAVDRAGKALAHDILWDENRRDEINNVFEIANRWRASHDYSMASVRASVRSKVRKISAGGITVARSKTMRSIRKKLRRINCSLNQINDIVGCRAIVDDNEDVRRLVTLCRDTRHHRLIREYDYIGSPKDGGYRSYHLVYQFLGNESRGLKTHGQRIELQIRTRLQHAWATAVEAIGLYRGEDLKAGEGNEGWLEFFKLISRAFCLLEEAPAESDGKDAKALFGRIGKLANDLEAINTLEDVKNFTLFHEEHQTRREESDGRYLIVYKKGSEGKGGSVEIIQFDSPDAAHATLLKTERSHTQGAVNGRVVLVAADKISALKEAYPNYFGDVSLLISKLKNDILSEENQTEYILKPQARAPVPPREAPDYSIFNRNKMWVDKTRAQSKKKKKAKKRK